jgi:hypothetical protein
MSAPAAGGRSSALKSWVRALEATAAIDRGESAVLPVVFDTLAERFGDSPALLTREQTLSYRQLAEAVNR